MNRGQATDLAIDAIKTVTVEEPVPVADTTVLYLNEDYTYCVFDNGEYVDCQTQDDAIRIIVENLASYGE